MVYVVLTLYFIFLWQKTFLVFDLHDSIHYITLTIPIVLDVQTIKTTSLAFQICMTKGKHRFARLGKIKKGNCTFRTTIFVQTIQKYTFI